MTVGNFFCNKPVGSPQHMSAGQEAKSKSFVLYSEIVVDELNLSTYLYMEESPYLCTRT